MEVAKEVPFLHATRSTSRSGRELITVETQNEPAFPTPKMQ